MLSDSGNNVVAFFPVHLGDALNGQVVAFRGSGREDDFLCSCANQFGDALARSLNRLFTRPSERVITAGRIAEPVGEIGQHLFQNARINRRGRVIIHVNRQLHPAVSLRCCSLFSQRSNFRSHNCLSSRFEL